MKNLTKTSLRNWRERWDVLLADCRAIQDESGNALIEMALALSVCAVLMMGTAGFGRLIYASVEITNASRAGAQYGSQSHTMASDVAGMKATALLDGSDVPNLSATASKFCTCTDGSTSTCAAGDCSSSRLIEYVKVNTSATIDPGFYIAGLPHSYTFTGQTTMRVGQ